MGGISLSGKRLRYLTIVVSSVVLLSIPFWANRYVIHLAVLAGIGVILSLGLNVLLGYCGQINFGPIGFYAIGAYACAIVQTKLSQPFFLSLPLALVITGALAFVVGIPLLRLRGHTLALGTFALALAVQSVAQTWKDLTGGEAGIDVPPLMLLGEKMGSTFYYYVALVAVLVSYGACHRLVSSRVGRAMKAIREDEVAASSLGVSVARYIMTAWLFSAVLLGLAGALLGQYTAWVGPGYFSLWTNIVIIVMVVVGGVGSNLGAAIGGASIMLLPEALWSFKQYSSLAYGLILLLTLRFMPNGVVSLLKRAWSTRHRAESHGVVFMGRHGAFRHDD